MQRCRVVAMISLPIKEIGEVVTSVEGECGRVISAGINLSDSESDWVIRQRIWSVHGK